jgi:hypothetical protein
MIDSGSGFNIIGLQKGHLRYNVDDGITYQYIGGSANTVASWRVVFGSEAYGQFSNRGNIVPADVNPFLVTYVADEMRGMLLISSIGITIQEKGIYIVINGGQIAKTGGGGAAHFLDMWLRKNGVDIPNTGVRNTIIQTAETKVMVLNWAGALDIGDVLQKYIAVSNSAVGLGLYTLSNTVGALIPADIFTVVKIQ